MGGLCTFCVDGLFCVDGVFTSLNLVNISKFFSGYVFYFFPVVLFLNYLIAALYGKVNFKKKKSSQSRQRDNFLNYLIAALYGKVDFLCVV